MCIFSLPCDSSSSRDPLGAATTPGFLFSSLLPGHLKAFALGWEHLFLCMPRGLHSACSWLGWGALWCFCTPVSGPILSSLEAFGLLAVSQGLCRGSGWFGWNHSTGALRMWLLLCALPHVPYQTKSKGHRGTKGLDLSPDPAQLIPGVQSLRGLSTQEYPCWWESRVVRRAQYLCTELSGHHGSSSWRLNQSQAHSAICSSLWGSTGLHLSK